MERIVETHSEQQTESLGQELANAVQAGTVIALIGPLGAGKTRFSQAFSVALGVHSDEVRSPTFVLIHEYQGRLPVYHFDTYRLKDQDEWLELGADEFLSGDGVCLIEWADRVAELLPRDRINIEISVVGENARRFHIQATGEKSAAIVAKFDT